MQYRRDIDGLKAISLLSVVLCHAGFRFFGGGFVGVDVFFVVSGYLITSIILVEKKLGIFSLADFYERRARRILPALFFVMAICLPFAVLCLLPADMKSFLQSLVAVPAFFSNVLFWKTSGYFETASELKPLLHTWSLAIEEQFYLVFPVFLLLVWRVGQRWVIVVLTAVFVLSLGVAQWGAVNEPAGAFYLLPARGWELLVGALIAFYFSSNDKNFFSKPTNEIGSLVGFSCIVYSVLTFDKQMVWPGFYTLLPTLGSAFIIIFSSPQTMVGRLLGTKPLVGLGLASYSTYLWHHPLYAFAKQKSLSEPSVWMMCLLAFIAFILGHLTWRFVELPFRNMQRFTREKIVSYAAIGFAFFVALGSVGVYFSDGYQNAWVAVQSEKTKKTYLLVAANKAKAHFGVNVDGGHGDSPCRFNIELITQENQRDILNCHQRFGAGVAILGDSHAVDLFGAVLSNNPFPFIIGFTQPGCRPHTRYSECQYENFYKFVEKNPKVFKGVVYEQAGFYLLKSDRMQKGSRSLFLSFPMGAEVTGVVVDQDHVRVVHEYLRRLSRHVKVVWFGPRIEPHISDQTILRFGCDHDFTLRPNQREIFQNLDGYIFETVKNDLGVQFVSQNKVFGFDFPKDFMSCTQMYWSDGDHLSQDGEKFFGARFDVLSLIASGADKR
jgi:peptidoglycan/LPS O-acetylase OafA/YrhL